MDLARLGAALVEGEDVYTLVLDFKDAFKHLRTDATERRYLSGQALGGYFVYCTALFGARFTPPGEDPDQVI